MKFKKNIKPAKISHLELIYVFFKIPIKNQELNLKISFPFKFLNSLFNNKTRNFFVDVCIVGRTVIQIYII